MTPGRRPGGWSRGLEGLREHLRLLADRCRARRLRLRGAQVGREVGIGPRVRVDRPWGVALGPRVRLEQDVHLKLVVDGARVEIGERAYLGPGCQLDVQQGVRIGHEVLVGPGCVLVDHDHGTELGTAVARQPCVGAPIVVGDGAWIGARVVLLRGVHVGRGAVVGAGAVVTTSIPANAIAVGVPARVVGERPSPRAAAPDPSGA